MPLKTLVSGPVSAFAWYDLDAQPFLYCANTQKSLFWMWFPLPSPDHASRLVADAGLLSSGLGSQSGCWTLAWFFSCLLESSCLSRLVIP